MGSGSGEICNEVSVVAKAYDVIVVTAIWWICVLSMSVHMNSS